MESSFVSRISSRTKSLGNALLPEFGGDILDCLFTHVLQGLSSREPGRRSHFALLLEFVDNFGMLPSKFDGQAFQKAERAAWCHAENAKSLGNDHSLMSIERRRDSFEQFQPLQRGGSSWSLMWKHSSHTPPQDLRWRSEMQRPMLWIDVASLPKKCQIFHFVSSKSS